MLWPRSDQVGDSPLGATAKTWFFTQAKQRRPEQHLSFLGPNPIRKPTPRARSGQTNPWKVASDLTFEDRKFQTMWSTLCGRKLCMLVCPVHKRVKRGILCQKILGRRPNTEPNGFNNLLVTDCHGQERNKNRSRKDFHSVFTKAKGYLFGKTLE